MPHCFDLDVKISRPGAAKLLKEEPKSALSVLKAQPESAVCRFKHHFHLKELASNLLKYSKDDLTIRFYKMMHSDPSPRILT